MLRAVPAITSIAASTSLQREVIHLLCRNFFELRLRHGTDLFLVRLSASLLQAGPTRNRYAAGGVLSLNSKCAVLKDGDFHRSHLAGFVFGGLVELHHELLEVDSVARAQCRQEVPVWRVPSTCNLTIVFTFAIVQKLEIVIYKL